ncbi:sialidase family protein [Chitinophaga sp. sic0106]|uniref:sialidase family protein n=1 Tax=Chitinophaga sp. sic0106 TaxID=2854785 RepID=UPI001C479997|nr:sialidase family protein [Chitinophaga sp. sic0106]MBV7533363.1 glycoside hydrolase [Chitinophaga sp. sic0106]
MRIVWIAVIVLLSACSVREKPAARFLSHPDMAASCPYITHDAAGNLAISWIETDTANNSFIYYTISPDQGETFAAPVQVSSSAGVYPHDENLPKILFKPDGSIVAMFGTEANDARNKYAGKVMYTQSFDSGRTWQSAMPLVTDTAGYDQRYFDMALLPNGEAAAIWLDNRKTASAEGSTLYFAATSGRNGFGAANPVVETVCQCCRTKLLVDGKGAVHLVYRDIINDSIRDMVHQVSVDNGQHFSMPVRISADNWVVNGCPHTGPALGVNKAGLHFAWFTMGHGKGIFYCRSLDNGNTYTQKESLSDAPMAKHPQLAIAGEGDVYIAWDEPVKVGDDFNSRIGFVHKSPDGKTISSAPLTSDSTYANFPVVGTAGDKVMVVYKQRVGKSTAVACQVLLP